jgi:putative ABC transport system substrate-binding protein
VVATQRRQFLIATGALLVGTRAIAQPATAQSQRRVRKIGFLFAGTIALRPQVQEFEQGLRDQRFIEGENVTILRREAQGRLDQLPGLAVQLVSENPDVIVAVTSASVHAAVSATQSIPIVMMFVTNPVEQGWVKNLARPERNVTGSVYTFEHDYITKRLQLLKEMLPRATRIAVLWNAVMGSRWKAQLEQTAPTLALQIEPVSFRDVAELKAGLEKVGASGAHALFVFPDPAGFEQRKSIIEFAAARRIPVAFSFAEEAEDGGLMAYGPNLREEYRRAALYVGKILKGAKPADLPIELTKLELVVNLKTANALGLKVPPSVLLRADRVIE